MPTVFVAGSRQISRLPAEVGSRLDMMIEKSFQILVGDANCADKAVQRYLADTSYPSVFVHCMKDHCRNNIGNWPTRQLVGPARRQRFRVLLHQRSRDGGRRGIRPHAVGRQEQGHGQQRRQPVCDHKPVVVYVTLTRRFRTIKNFDDLDGLLAQGDQTAWSELSMSYISMVLRHRATG